MRRKESKHQTGSGSFSLKRRWNTSTRSSQSLLLRNWGLEIAHESEKNVGTGPKVLLRRHTHIVNTSGSLDSWIALLRLRSLLAFCHDFTPTTRPESLQRASDSSHVEPCCAANATASIIARVVAIILLNDGSARLQNYQRYFGSPAGLSLGPTCVFFLYYFLHSPPFP